jgi:hypothetical protein
MYAFCKKESETGRKWHIRQLGPEGYIFNGGVTTPSLCEDLKPGSGYDVSVPITKDQLLWCCALCAKAYGRLLVNRKQ